MSDYYKYPRTPHLPWSPGVQSDDDVLDVAAHFQGRNIVVTEKLDGENTSMYPDHIHARSVSSKHHPSRSLVKALHAQIQHDIPEGWRICGENVFAKHSIFYTHLTASFYVFAIYDEDNNCISWDDTLQICEVLNLLPAPVLYRGPWDEDRVKACWTGQSNFGTEQEGYVVRFDDQFRYEDHAKCVAKYVRANHVQTSTHWMQEEVVPNEVI